MSFMSGLLLAFWVCLWGLHPRDLGVEGWPADTEPLAIQVPSSSQPLGTNDHESKRSIVIVQDEFFLDGKSLQILSGSVHYFRMPAEYWRDRLRKVKAAGLNAVATYVEWSFHEPEERQYRFSGDHDVAQFVRIAAEEGLLVLLRPGPYICAERDLGGLPYWLLHKYPHIRLRTTDKDFIEETRTWFAKLFQYMTPLLYENRGPIILVQVENEYGSYGSDMPYKEQVRDIIQSHVNHKALLYTTDGYSSRMINGGMVPGALPTIDFGVGQDIRRVFGPLRQVLPDGPLMNSEFYPGWLTHWGESLQEVNKNSVVYSLRNMIDNKINVNIYVFHGGSNFEFSSGANVVTTFYAPDITSYDYDAPLDEAGDPTPKYYAIRELMETYNASLKNTSLPKPSPKVAYGKLKLEPRINLMSEDGRSKLGKRYDDVTGATLPTFERLKQRAGLMLYETTLSKPQGMLEITDPRDRIYVYLAGELKGVIDRMAKRHTLSLNSDSSTGSILSLLVENQGRVNYGQKLHDFKGILSQVKFNNKPLDGQWSITGFSLEQLEGVEAASNQPSTKFGPMLYEASFTLPEGQEGPMDTYIDPTGWGKGYVWVNGHNLGRYWPGRGPQVTLYVPGVWLLAAPAQNSVQLLELERPPDKPTVEFLDYFILNRTSSDSRIADPNDLIFDV